MSNLTSTVPGAFSAMHGLLSAAGEALDPKVPVFHTELVQNEPASYVLLKGIENHSFDIAALGSYAHEETYDIVGVATVLQGNVDAQAVLVRTWALYQAVVMTPVVENRGALGTPVLGSDGAAQGRLWVAPNYARYSGEPGSFGGGMAGFAGTVEFAYTIKARITVP